MAGRTGRALVALVLVASAGPSGVMPWVRPAQAQSRAAEGWRKEFDEVCGKTQDAMTLPTAELRALVERCDKLAPVVQGLGEPERKVYAKRLEGCRNLYAFVLESRQER